jgi:hypothetical protein
MHAVLGHFVNSARRWFMVCAVKVIEWTGTLADGEAVFDGLRDVCLGKHHGFA